MASIEQTEGATVALLLAEASVAKSDLVVDIATSNKWGESVMSIEQMEGAIMEPLLAEEYVAL